MSEQSGQGGGAPRDGGSPPGYGRPQRLVYKVLTGPDDHAFCERVSAALAEGYRLHGGPALTFDGTSVIVGQAVVLEDPARGSVVPAVQPVMEV
jgi:hypothetical protein